MRRFSKEYFRKAWVSSASVFSMFPGSLSTIGITGAFGRRGPVAKAAGEFGSAGMGCPAVVEPPRVLPCSAPLLVGELAVAGAESFLRQAAPFHKRGTVNPQKTKPSFCITLAPRLKLADPAVPQPVIKIRDMPLKGDGSMG